MAVAAGVSAANFDNDYKLLSSLAHPNGFGVQIMDVTTLADNEWQIWFAQIVWIAQTYLELGGVGGKDVHVASRLLVNERWRGYGWRI